MNTGMPHICHNPNCLQPLPSNLVVHSTAWYQIPKAMRDNIWKSYRKGQEINKRPSAAYLVALRDVLAYLKEHNIQCQ